IHGRRPRRGVDRNLVNEIFLPLFNHGALECRVGGGEPVVVVKFRGSWSGARVSRIERKAKTRAECQSGEKESRLERLIPKPRRRRAACRVNDPGFRSHFRVACHSTLDSSKELLHVDRAFGAPPYDTMP